MRLEPVLKNERWAWRAGLSLKSVGDLRRGKTENTLHLKSSWIYTTGNTDQVSMGREEIWYSVGNYYCKY